MLRLNPHLSRSSSDRVIRSLITVTCVKFDVFHQCARRKLKPTTRGNASHLENRANNISQVLTANIASARLCFDHEGCRLTRLDEKYRIKTSEQFKIYGIFREIQPYRTCLLMLNGLKNNEYDQQKNQINTLDRTQTIIFCRRTGHCRLRLTYFKKLVLTDPAHCECVSLEHIPEHTLQTCLPTGDRTPTVIA